MGAAFLIKILAVSYSHMGRPHTTIGAERFHFRVRNGIGWFPLAIAARKTGWTKTVGAASAANSGLRPLLHSVIIRINNNLEKFLTRFVAFNMSHKPKHFGVI